MLPLAGRELAADLHFSELPPDLSVIQELEPPLQRAMRANVLIERQHRAGGAGRKGDRLGVILQIERGEALIVTNRHVVDDDFPSSRGSASRCRPSQPAGPDVGQHARPAGKAKAESSGWPPARSTWLWFAPVAENPVRPGTPPGSEAGP